MIHINTAIKGKIKIPATGMATKTHRFGASPVMLLLGFLIISVVAVNGADETTAPGEEVKCGSCTTPVPPPPPPPVPCPPPPSPPPPVEKPPPSPKKPPTTYCPPPPPSYIYITGPPGDLYTTDQSFGGAGRTGLAGGMPVLAVGFAVLGLFLAV